MGKVFVDMGMSLDGYIAGPNRGPDNPLGDGGPRIHEWMFRAHSWRERQQLGGGEANQDDAIADETFSRAGAYIMGRHMFEEGEHHWPDPPPFQAPVFVLTSQPRDPWVRQGGTTFTFVTDGIERALREAQSIAGEKDVQISGGANVVRQYLNAGYVDDIQIHLAPILLGAGVRLFDCVDTDRARLSIDRVVQSSDVIHMGYAVTMDTLA